MKIGGFQINDHVPECDEPYVIAILRPWIDVNNVGTMVLDELETRFSAVELGRLHRPGCYYDFTRYRPIIHLDEGIHGLSVPNTMIHLVKREGQRDLLLLRLLEPHANSEHYISSVLKVLRRFNARKYILLGSMYDMVPHTRPLLISGYGTGENSFREVEKAGALPITYRGPSTIVNLITKEAAGMGIDAVAFIVSLPQYVVLEEDHQGKARLMEVLNMLYGIPMDKGEFERALVQRDMINERLKDSPEMIALLPQLENVYDNRMKEMGETSASQLSPEVEELFWKTFGKDVGKA